MCYLRATLCSWTTFASLHSKMMQERFTSEGSIVERFGSFLLTVEDSEEEWWGLIFEWYNISDGQAPKNWLIYFSYPKIKIHAIEC